MSGLTPLKYKLNQTTVPSPVAKKIPYAITTHGHERVDNYYWMRDDSRTDPEVLAHLAAENSYASSVLAGQKVLQRSVFDELKSRILKDDKSLPVKDGRYWYHSEINGEQEFSNFYRATSAGSDAQKLLLDVNLRAADHEFYDMGEVSVSPNDKLLSFSEDTDGRRIYTIYFKQINPSSSAQQTISATGASSAELLADVLIETEGDMVWANDNVHVFYVKKDLQTLLGTQVYRHELGTLQSQDCLVYQQTDLSFYMSLGKSRDDSVIFIGLQATDSSDTLVLDANAACGHFKPIFSYTAGHEYHVDKVADDYYIVTNWQAQNFRLMRASVADISDQGLWQELLPHSESVLLESVDLFDQYYVLTLREKGQIRFQVESLDDSEAGYPLVFDESCYAAAVADNPDPKSHYLRLYYSSLTTPASWYEFDLTNGNRRLLKQQQVLAGFDPANYHSERLFVTSRDGVEVPVSLVYRKSLFKSDGSNPLLQYAYGAYGITIDPSFSSSVFSLLDRGFVYAIAHVRGSEMLGRQWYEQGKKQYKQNTFNDFVDVTSALVARGYAAENKVFASGGSAGGLLMAAIVNQAPQFYLGVGCHVPFVDVLTTMLDDTIPLTTNEYDEWGNPHNPDDYKVIFDYSPYDNICPQAYPHILVTTGLHDSQVQYFEPMKWVAKLRELKTDDRQLVFKIDMDAGHGGASGRFKALHETALEMAFFISLLEH